MDNPWKLAIKNGNFCEPISERSVGKDWSALRSQDALRPHRSSARILHFHRPQGLKVRSIRDHCPMDNYPVRFRALYDLVPVVCRELKPNALALVDAVAPPDFVLNSAIGHSSGKIYDQLKETFYRSPDTFERAPHWREIVSMLNKSKL